MATDWSKLKVVDLKAELKRLGLPQSGLKAELVARLEANDAAAAEQDASEPQDEMPDETEEVNGKPQDQSQAPEAPEAPEAREATEPTHADDLTKPAEAEATRVAPDTEPPVNETQAPLAQSSNATPLQSAEVIQDSQKRKRRSLSPAPSIHEAARKRAKQDDNAQYATSENVDEAEAPQADVADPSQAPPEVEMEGANEEGPVDREGSQPGNALPSQQNGNLDDVMEEAQPDVQEPVANRSPSPKQTYAAHPTDLERDVEPSIHPATSALYIKDFMRPLRPQAVKDHLLDLATPVGTPIDDSTIVNFYLDTIRTHAFVVFSNISAASRVRTTLHNRVWPDETNRKALWVDFIPPERFEEWVDMEQASTGGRGATNRYEVTYLHDANGALTVGLEEFDGMASTKQEPRGPAPEPERKQSIPTGPSRPFSGIEGAPTGPRGFQASRGPSMHPSRSAGVEQAGLPTRAYPTVAYQPVPDELAERRLDALAAAKTKHDTKDYSKEYRRYYFERGDLLVDRGREIFLGIRPPHRERQRERERERFPGRGGRRGGRSRRNGMPIFHGVPKGGDRFRPGDSSNSGPNSRSRYADDRSSRRDNYSRYNDDRGSRRDGYGRY
ncbi:hypothetical protein GGR52DRAFT_547517 [Hypoxylon sp. FL1284]|nr:hypothetical protein GGR52DRAFT_547517 [Hypoxylon sp. FL1284]